MRNAAALLILVVLTACARLGLGGVGGGAGPSDAPPSILGSWSLQRGSGPSGEIRVPTGSRATIAFDGHRVSGQACNLYGGDYRLDGTAITLSAMAMTEMACEEPMMTLEADFHAALAKIRTVVVDGGTLTLTGAGAELVFTRLAPIVDADLVGTHWTLTTLYSGEAASSTFGKGWLQLRADGRLSGSTGCRDFDASYQLTGDRLSITDLVNEDNACDPAADDQDQLVLELLRGGLAYTIDGSQLTLSDAGMVGGKGLGYTAASS